MLSVALLAAGAQPSKNELVLGKLAALEGELEMLKPTKMETHHVVGLWLDTAIQTCTLNGACTRSSAAALSH